MKKHNLTFEKKDMASGQVSRLKEYHKINPNEVGLIEYPSLKKQVSECLLNQEEN